MKKTLLILFFLVSITPSFSRGKVKVACVGNSVTYGYGLAHRETQSYPARLQQLLGDNYEVRNFGHNGATLLRRAFRPYDKLPEFRQALDFKADIAIIHLGLNDTDPRAWPQYGDEFIADYHALIDSFRVANPAVKIWVCELTPIFHDHHRFDTGTREWHEKITQKIRQIAATYDCGLIDLYSPLHHRPDLFPDALHPNAEGADILARTVCSSITGNHGGLSLPPIFGNGMVMQRMQPVEFYGKANAGEKVTIRFDKKKSTVTADASGRWRAEFPARPAGGPYTADIQSHSGHYTIQDIWMGEVWLCSGQSNMELTVRSTLTAKRDIAAADTLTRLHLYNMPSIVPTYATEWDSARLDSVNRLLYILPGKWERPSSQNVPGFSSIGYNFGRILADSLGCHVGIISNAVGGSTTEGWIDRSTLEREIPGCLRNWLGNDYVMPWARERAQFNIRQSRYPRQRHPYEPAYLFESGIMPLQSYPIQGVLWYQGESNAHNIELHERMFTLLEKSWRKNWNNPELPFYFVQLSGISTRDSWPRFRDSQRRLAGNLPYTWMAVSSDLGDSLDVHPRHKYEIAQRLACAVLCHTYRHHVVPSGPSYTGFTTEGSSLRLHFDYAEGLCAASSSRISGFEVAGPDGIYHLAEAAIEGKTVVVKSKNVKEPCAVRYAFRPFPVGNLENGAGLPASTFCDEHFSF